MMQIKDAFDAVGVSCTSQMAQQLELYMEGILSWNEKVNLTSITDRNEFLVKHFLDSVLCCGFPEFQTAKHIIDVGTGGGFPGVPLAVVSPEKQFILMDSLKKRLNIIDELTSSIGIRNVSTVHARAEELARNKEHREQYDLCVSRAVANLATLSEYCLPFIRQGGYLLAYKGPDAEEEIAQAKKAIFLLGGQLERIESAPLNRYGLDHRILFIKKVRNTPAKYPRKAGTPSKDPLK